MTNLTSASFFQVLINDVAVAEGRRSLDDTQTHRREVVRVVFSAVEGLLWYLKQQVLIETKGQLSAIEHSALSEEAYTVDPRGQVNATPRFLPLTTSIRLLVRLYTRHKPTYTLDLNQAGWSKLKSAIEVRNRIVHPKSLEDLAISEDEVEGAVAAFGWMVALALEMQSEILDSLKEKLATALEASSEVVDRIDKPV